MSSKYENFSTIKGKYLGVEVKEGFDKFKLGDTEIEIEMRPRTGVGKYTNFSNLLYIIASNPENKYQEGEYVWVSNKTVDDRYYDEGRYIYPFLEEGVAFVGKDITNSKSEYWVLTKVKKQEVKEQNGIFLLNKEKDDVAVVLVSGFEDIPVGSTIESLSGRRAEFWQKEEQYWAVIRERITSVDGQPYGKFYHLDKFETFETEHNGIVIKGNKAAQIHYNVQPNRNQILARLSNPSLPYHGKVAIVEQRKSKANYAETVTYLVEDREIVLG